MNLENENTNIINLNDSNSITLFGADVQKNIAELSGRLLKSIEETGVDDMSHAITSTVSCLNNFSAEKNEAKGIFKLFKRNVYDTENRKQDLIKQVENMETVLDKYRVQLLMDSAMLDQLFKMNQECASSLKEKIEIAKQKKQELAGSPSTHDINGVANNIAAVLDNRINDLELSLMLSVQQTAQIGMLRESTSTMAMRIQGTLYNVIPLWRNQICSNVSSENKNMVTNGTDELAEANQTLISSLGEIAHVHEASKVKKREAGLVLSKC